MSDTKKPTKYQDGRSGSIKNFGNKRRNGPGPKKGSRHKKTLQAAARLEELGCDPIELSAKIAMGEELTQNHPFLTTLRKYVHEIEFAVRHQKGVGILTRLEEMLTDGRAALTDSWTAPAMRSKHIRDLMTYTHQRQNQGMGDVQVTHEVKPLLKRDVVAFNKWFSENY